MISTSRIVSSIKIFPKDIIISPDELKEAIGRALPKTAFIHRIDEEPIAFGLVVLIAHIVMPEMSGELDKVEEAIRGVEGVSEVETLLVRKI